MRSPQFWVSGYCTKWRIQGSFQSSYSRSLNVKTKPRSSILASIASDMFVKCICRNISCAQGKRSLDSRWTLIATSTELHGHGDERWPMEWRQIRISAVSEGTAVLGVAKEIRQAPCTSWLSFLEADLLYYVIFLWKQKNSPNRAWLSPDKPLWNRARAVSAINVLLSCVRILTELVLHFKTRKIENSL